MKQSIQDKIELIKQLAKTNHSLSGVSYPQVSNSNDSLLQGIRNKEDANLFMAELDAAIKVSQSNR